MTEFPKFEAYKQECIQRKAQKLGVSISIDKVETESDAYQFRILRDKDLFAGEIYREAQSSDPGQVCYSIRELEDTLDDMLDPGFRQAEARADRRFVENAYGIETGE